MANADGSVIIKADIDDKQAQKELNALEKKIEALQEKLTNKKSARDTLFNQANNLGAQLDDAKAKLAQMKGGGEFFTSDAIKQQEAAVASMEKEWNAMNDKLDKQNAAIREGEAELDRMKTKAGELGKQLGNTGKNAGKIQKGLDKASQGMEAFTKRVKMLAKRALVFTIIARALAALRDWMADVVAVNGEARDAIAQLKGALLTLAQPLVQIIIPAFTALVKILATVVSFIANIVSALFGTTAKESANAAKSLNDQKNAYKGVGGAAKSASKQLASFDEINKLSGEGGGGFGVILPDFSTAANFAFLDKIADKLKKIGQDIVNLFKDITGYIGNVFSGDWGAALDNIADFVNHARILLADLLDFVGYIFGAIIDTIIEKCRLAGTPVGDMLAGIKGIVQGGLGLISSILTGDLEKMKQSVIQMLTGVKTFVFGILNQSKMGLTSLLDWLDKKTNGRFHEIIELAKTYVNDVIEGVKQIFGGFIEFLTGVFTLDWGKAWEGIKEIFRGICNTIVSVFEAAVNLIIKGINWLISKINTIQIKIPDWLGGGSFEFNFRPITELQIPRLAKGAVIPPNREFLAVLGDQKRGTNVEAPLETIQQAVAQTFANMSPQFAQAIVAAFIATGMIGNIQAIEDYTRATATKDFTLGTPNSATGRWVDQSLAAYARVKG
jgi:predicted  nucleic acid-binding Zn-ribbon protein|nr:MAG TPA_asm: minor tail protein [Caudoviricetes sp.]